MEQLTPYNVVLYPTPGYFLHFLVFATTPVEAVHKINYQARLSLPAVNERYPNNAYGKLDRIKAIIKATRRYKRKHKPRFGSRKSVVCTVNQIPINIVHSGQLEFGVHTESLIQNFLPDLLHPPIGNE